MFRIAECLQGNNGYLLRHEEFLSIFDALLIAAVMIAINIFHPGDIATMLAIKMSSDDELSMRSSRWTSGRKPETDDCRSPV